VTLGVLQNEYSRKSIWKQGKVPTSLPLGAFDGSIEVTVLSGWGVAVEKSGEADSHCPLDAGYHHGKSRNSFCCNTKR
jgi:hypothetical protein